MATDTYTWPLSPDFKHPDKILSAEISSVSTYEVTLSFKDFSFDKYEKLLFIIKETELSTSVSLSFTRRENFFTLDLTSLKSLFEFRYNKEFHIYVQGIHNNTSELFLLKDSSKK